MSYSKNLKRDWTITCLDESGAVIFLSKKDTPCSALVDFRTKEVALYRDNRLVIQTSSLSKVIEYDPPFANWVDSTEEDILDIALMWVREGYYKKRLFEK